MITGDDLENREGAAPRRGRRPAPDPAPAAKLSPALVAEAAALKPPKDGIHCGCCWGRGRDAVIELLEREAPSQG